MPAGYFGIATAIVAWYISAAGVINETWGRIALPLWPVQKNAEGPARRDRVKVKGSSVGRV